MQDTDFETGFWAVIGTQGFGMLIGNLREDPADRSEPEEMLHIESAYQLKSEVVPVQTPQGMGMSSVRQLIPLGDCTGSVNVRAHIGGYIAFKDMSDTDRARHIKLVIDLEKRLMEMRLQNAGIELPKTGRMHA